MERKQRCWNCRVAHDEFIGDAQQSMEEQKGIARRRGITTAWRGKRKRGRNKKPKVRDFERNRAAVGQHNRKRMRCRLVVGKNERQISTCKHWATQGPGHAWLRLGPGLGPYPDSMPVDGTKGNFACRGFLGAPTRPGPGPVTNQNSL